MLTASAAGKNDFFIGLLFRRTESACVFRATDRCGERTLRNMKLRRVSQVEAVEVPR